MSLINDALQRAKQVQQTSPAGEGNLQLRPADPASPRQKTFGPVWFVVLGAALLAGIASMIIGLDADPGHATPIEAAAKSSAQNLQSTIDSGPTAPEIQIAAAAPEIVPTTESSAEAVSEISSSTSPTTPPPPPAPKLQGILFNPTRPSAIIDGKTVFVGTVVGNLRVAAINPTSAILVGYDQTNVVSLESEL